MANLSPLDKMRAWAVRLTQWLVGKKDLTECGHPAERSCQGRILACSLGRHASDETLTAMRTCLFWTLEKGREGEVDLPELVEFAVHAANAEAHLRSLFPERFYAAMVTLAQDGDDDIKAPAEEIRARVSAARRVFLPPMGAIQKLLRDQDRDIRSGKKATPEIRAQIRSALIKGAKACGEANKALTGIPAAATRLCEAALAAKK